MEDCAIIALYWDRNENAIIETNQKFGPYCHTIAYNILENQEDSEECVNDTWLKAWNSMPPQRPNYLRLYLGKITRNLSIDVWKNKQAQKRGNGEFTLALEELNECVADTRSIEDVVQTRELAGCIEAFLMKEPKREREIFVARYFYVKSTAEIARDHGIKESYVLVLLSRTRKKLAQYLQKEGYAL